MKTLLKIYSGIVIILFYSSCEKNYSPVSSDVDNFTSHDFEWAADTLAPGDAHLISLYDIWGTDESNIWCVGESIPRNYQVWHWDGVTWKHVDPVFTGSRPFYSGIFGFSKENFWVVGYTSLDNGYVLHNDGDWRKVDNNELSACLSIWGSSSQNLYIGCNKGLIFRYDGEKFIRYETGRNLQITTIWGLETGEIFAIGVNNDNQPAEPPTRYFFEYKQDQFALRDSSILTLPGDQAFGMDLWGTDSNNLYSPNGQGLTKYNKGDWNVQFYAPLYRVSGSSSNNIFTGGFYDVVYHYNGTDWAEVYSGNHVTGGIWGLWCNENNVFVIQHQKYFTRILKGKRK